MPNFFKKQPRPFRKSPHAATALAFVVVFATVGTYLLLASHAASNPVQLQIALDRSLCMDNRGDSSANKNPVVISACSTTVESQQWTIENVSGGFLIKNGAGTCVDDTGDGVGTSPSNRVYLQTYACNSADHAQIWKWTGSTPSQLQNAYNNGCINDPGFSKTAGTQLLVFTCSPATNNAQWYEVTVTPPKPSVSITAPAKGATVSGSSVNVSAKASVSSGSITHITLKVGGATLASCTNTSTCSHSWNTKSVANGSYTVQANVTASGSGTSQTSETIKVSNASSSPKPPSNPSPKPGPTPKPTGGATSSSSPAGTSGNHSSGGAAQSSSGASSSNSDTTTLALLKGQPSFSARGKPAVSNIQALSVTAHSITLAWQAVGATSFTIKYGSSAGHLTNSRTIQSTDASPSVTLNNLPTGHETYIQVTPINGSVSGTSQLIHFKTSSGGSVVGVIILIVLMVVAAGFALTVFVRRRQLDQQQTTVQFDDNLPIYEPESEGQREARLNWWLPEENREQLIHPEQNTISPQQPPTHPTDEEFPDMYEEGRRRLAEEEKRRPPET